MFPRIWFAFGSRVFLGPVGCSGAAAERCEGAEGADAGAIRSVTLDCAQSITHGTNAALGVALRTADLRACQRRRHYDKPKPEPQELMLDRFGAPVAPACLRYFRLRTTHRERMRLWVQHSALLTWRRAAGRTSGAVVEKTRAGAL